MPCALILKTFEWETRVSIFYEVRNVLRAFHMVKAECGKTRENKETPCVPSHVCYVRDLQFKEGVSVSLPVCCDKQWQLDN